MLNADYPESMFREAVRCHQAASMMNNTSITPEEIRSLIGKHDPIILDIGCNDGTETKKFLSVFTHPHVFCFDPEPRAQRNFEVNVQDPRATLFKVALGAVDGEIDFYPSDGLPIPDWARVRPEGWDYSGSIRRPKNHITAHPWCKFREPVKIQAMRLDTWSVRYQLDMFVDFIWADVQGAEVDLIAGGRETLKRTRFFYTEYSDQEMYEGQVTLSQLLSLLPGFELVHQYPDDVLLRNTRI